MNRLSIDERGRILAALVEGNSIRSVCRMLGREKRTVTRLLVEVGTACYRYQDRVLRNLKCQRLEGDEIWSFIGCKQKHVYELLMHKRFVKRRDAIEHLIQDEALKRATPRPC